MKTIVTSTSLMVFTKGSKKGLIVVDFSRAGGLRQYTYYENPSNSSLRRLYRAVDSCNLRVIPIPTVTIIGWIAYRPRQKGK